MAGPADAKTNTFRAHKTFSLQKNNFGIKACFGKIRFDAGNPVYARLSLIMN